MTKAEPKIQPFNIVIIGQSNRLQYEALLFAASFVATNPDFLGRFFVAMPQPGPLWPDDPSIKSAYVIELIKEFGAEILPFESRHFGQSYPYGNKIEALAALPEGEPFVFFDTDTLILDDLTEVPFDFDRPAASMRVEGTWPKLELYGPGYSEIWKSLYDRFGLDFESSLDLSQPDEYWRRYLYFNAGFFYYKCPKIFGDLFAEYAMSIKTDPPEPLICQSLNPWLDQVALPLVIHKLGGGRDALPDGYLDGNYSCHYRLLPMLYARESDKAVTLLEDISAPNRIKKVLKQYEPIKRFVYQGKGERARNMFDREDLPRREQMIRQRLKKNGLWLR
ncbi:hypothetical protein TG4357_02685 [Thalassovita gelatinovora]|uniref:Glycosyl transferase family 8 n=1 Tax=Thalassovita gelatinovora TaxID=53501 RepID=A0A0P1FFX9_THAGE|nr:hypothetical protein [Thalassovita gelatinovora]QIZ79810.1 hypothetical protein HFZ77_04595 [Thalassovita gelatinovora]CUH66867.1 hypothetical protein TG4357_02685 [Thalassovita gelatinovora]SEQ44142.1 hypothetical protein SAMN04488043_105222 [Thalassovita gelatinovora]